MRFERLNSSIALNSKESPSIYMAICMIESLFKDVEDASGKDISHTQPGDEQLPTKLIWLARSLLKIYGENSSSFQRNQDRLDAMMAKIRSAEAELAQQDGLVKQLAALKERDEALEEQLIAANARKQETESLKSRCQELEAMIGELRAFDPAAARQKLNLLSGEVDKLSKDRMELRTSLDHQARENAALEEECRELQQRCAQSRERWETLNSDKHRVESESSTYQTKIADYSREVEALEKAKEQMVEELAVYKHQLSQLQQENAEYQAKQLAPIIAQRDRQLEDNNGLKRILETKNKELETAITERTILKMKLDSAEKRTAEAQAEVAQRRISTEAAEAKAEELRARKDAELQHLEMLQQEIAEYENSQLPELQDLISAEEKNRDELTSRTEGMRQQQEELAEAVLRLQQEDESLKQTLAEHKQVHARLTGGLQARTQELELLKEKIRELEGKNVKEQEQTFRRRLESDARDLEEAERACQELSRQLQEYQAALKVKQDEEEQLRSKKLASEEAEHEINERLRILTPYKDPKLRQQVQELLNRQKLLSETHERLERSIRLMQEVLDEPPETLTTDPEGLRESLENCGKALDMLQRSLVRCANLTESEIKLH